MKLKFLVTTAAGKRAYHAGETHEIKDLHAAEVYIAHGYAVTVDGAAPPSGETLRRGYPTPAGPEPAKATERKMEAGRQESRSGSSVEKPK